MAVLFNYECGCLIGLDEVRKASDKYDDDIRDHECSECENFRTGADGLYYCELTGDEAGRYDDACDDFKERQDEN